MYWMSGCTASQGVNVLNSAVLPQLGVPIRAMRVSDGALQRGFVAHFASSGASKRTSTALALRRRRAKVAWQSTRTAMGSRPNSP